MLEAEGYEIYTRGRERYSIFCERFLKIIYMIKINNNNNENS